VGVVVDLNPAKLPLGDGTVRDHVGGIANLASRIGNRDRLKLNPHIEATAGGFAGQHRGRRMLWLRGAFRAINHQPLNCR
jgi:uncharacterized protein YfaQ (DUF2300 family)